MPRYEFLCEKCQKTVRTDHDHRGAREGEGPVPDVQEHESRAAAQRLHGADEEEELTGLLIPDGNGLAVEPLRSGRK